MNLRHNLILCFISLIVGTSTSNGAQHCHNLTSDIIFFINPSSNSAQGLHGPIGDFVTKVLLLIKEHIQQNRTRIASVAFSTDFEICFNLSSSLSCDSDMDATCIKNMLHSCFDLLAGKKTYKSTGIILQQLAKKLLADARFDVVKYIIFMAEIYSEDEAELNNWIMFLQSQNVQTIVVASAVITSSAEHVFVTSQFPVFKLLEDDGSIARVERELTEFLCTDAHRRSKRSDCDNHVSLEAEGGRNCVGRIWWANGPNPEDYRFEGAVNGSCLKEGSTNVRQIYIPTGAVVCTIYFVVTVHRCPSLPTNFPFGNRYCSGDEDNVYESYCTFYCDFGYVLRGSSRVTCDVSGNSYQWDNAFPSCHEQHCSILPVFANGNRQCTGQEDNVYKSVCSHTCDIGYVLNGSAKIECLGTRTTTGLWNTSFPVCQMQHCATLPFFPYGRRICSGAEDSLYKSVCVHTCDSEFTIHGSSSVECLGTTSATGLWNTTFPVCHASTPPNLRTCRISVTDTQGTVTFSGYQGNNTSCANQRNEWIKAQPREVYFVLQADHNPNLSKPAGVSEVKAGVVGALIRLTTVSSSGGEKVVSEEVLDSTAFCQENISSTSPLFAGRIHICEGNLTLPSLNLNDGESLCADITAFSGGYYNLVDRNSSFQRQVVFEQVPTTKRVCFMYDSIKPVHCFDAGCNIEPLELSSRTTRTPSVRAIVRGWEDPVPPNGSLLAASQISTYKLEVHHVNVGLNNLTVENDAITQWTKEWSAVPGYSYDVNISLPKENPQLYAIVLEVHDHADNIGYARRLVMFDNSSSVKLLDSAPIWVTSADPLSNFTWQSNVTREVCVDWRDRFYNNGMRDNDFLLPVDVDTTREIYSYYDQINGVLPINGTNNVHGIVKFEFSWCDPGGNCSLMEEVSPVELQTACFHENLQDCDVCEIQVKSTDVMGNTKEDSTHVSIDHSEPDVNIQESHGMIGPFGIHVCSTTELAKVVLKVQALDPHSGIRTLQWAIRLPGQTDNLYNGTVDVHRLQNGLNCTGKSNCYCPCVGSCELYEHELKFSYREVAVSKNNTGVVHQSQYNIIITATNNAGLQFSKEVDIFIQTDSSSPALILDGMKRATHDDTEDDDMTVWITVGAVLGTCLLIGAYVSYLIWRRRKRAANQIGVSKGANNRGDNKSDQRRKQRLRRGSLTTIAN